MNYTTQSADYAPKSVSVRAAESRMRNGIGNAELAAIESLPFETLRTLMDGVTRFCNGISDRRRDEIESRACEIVASLFVVGSERKAIAAAVKIARRDVSLAHKTQDALESFAGLQANMVEKIDSGSTPSLWAQYAPRADKDTDYTPGDVLRTVVGSVPLYGSRPMGPLTALGQACVDWLAYDESDSAMQAHEDRYGVLVDSADPDSAVRPVVKAGRRVTLKGATAHASGYRAGDDKSAVNALTHAVTKAVKAARAEQGSVHTHGLKRAEKANEAGYRPLVEFDGAYGHAPIMQALHSPMVTGKPGSVSLSWHDRTERSETVLEYPRAVYSVTETGEPMRYVRAIGPAHLRPLTEAESKPFPEREEERASLMPLERGSHTGRHSRHDETDSGMLRAFKPVVSPRKRSGSGSTGPTTKAF